MPTLTIEYQTDAERMALEQAVAYVRGLNQRALAAPHGTALAACEQHALSDGRQLLRDTLATALQARADATDAPKKFPADATRGVAPAGS